MKRRLKTYYLIYLLLCIVLTVFFFETMLGVPHSIIYVTDVLVLGLMLLNAAYFFRRMNGKIKMITCYLVVFAAVALLGLLINHQSILLFLWGFRNNFRFYGFFLACIVALKTKRIRWILKAFEIFLYANTLMCSFQFFILKLGFDNIGGFFGVKSGGNGYLNILMVITTIYATVRYLHKDMKLVRYFAIIACCVYIAIIGEIKIYYVELILILLLPMLFGRLSKRILVPMVCSMVGMVLIAVIIVKMTPLYWEGFFTPQGIWAEAVRASGYSAAGDLNRLTAVSTIFDTIFDRGWQAVCGFGLGSCDYSGSFSFLTSDFYRQYEYLHYQWLSVAFLFLELGFVGLALFFGFFVVVFVHAFQLNRNSDLSKEDKILCQISGCFAICCILLTVYNSMMRTEAAYMVYTILSIPYILSLKYAEKKENCE